MPRKTARRPGSSRADPWCFNEAAARCHGKLVEVREDSDPPPLLLQ